MEKKVSYYLNGITTTKPYKAVALPDVVRAIKCRKSEKLTESLRAISNEEQSARFKRTHFDYVTFSGTFSARKSSKLLSYSGYMVIDLDEVDPLVVKQKLLRQHYFDVALMFTSPGGYGVKVVVNSTTAQQHKQVFRMYQRCFERRLGVKVDNSGSDIARACFVAYDKDVYFNPNAKWRKLTEFWNEDKTTSSNFAQSATKMPVYTSGGSSGGYNGRSPFDDFNTRGDIVSLLKAHQWSVNKTASNGKNIRLTRPGKQEGISADIRLSDKLLYVFTNNSPFEPMKAYNPAQAFAILECSGNFTEAYKKLLQMGYGEPPQSNWHSNSTLKK